MPRNKTFRKRNPKKIQKGGAFDVTKLSKIDSTKTTKYYAYVVKTRKIVYGGPPSHGSEVNRVGIGGGGGSGIGGGGGGFVVALTTSPPENEYEYKTTIIDEEQKTAICKVENKKLITSAGAANNLNQFVEKNTGDEVITIFELNDGNPIDLNGLTITKENVKWDNYVVC